MKRIIVLVYILFCFHSPVGYADFQYRIEANGTATITNYSGSDMALTIPSTYLGRPVTSIGSNAFHGCVFIRSITVGNGVTSIGEFAFDECFSLSNISIGSNVTSIGRGAFNRCWNLTDVSIPNGVTSIKDATFFECGLQSVTVGYSVNRVGILAFAYCQNLTSVFFKGNAPYYDFSSMNGQFNGNDQVVVYYRAETVGWSNSFAGRPTTIWPEFLNTEIKPAGLTFRISTSTNQKVVIESCSNLAASSWSPILTNTSSSNTVTVTIPGWTNAPLRYYRATLK